MNYRHAYRRFRTNIFAAHKTSTFKNIYVAQAFLPTVTIKNIQNEVHNKDPPTKSPKFVSQNCDN